MIVLQVSYLLSYEISDLSEKGSQLVRSCLTVRDGVLRGGLDLPQAFTHRLEDQCHHLVSLGRSAINGRLRLSMITCVSMVCNMIVLRPVLSIFVIARLAVSITMMP